MTELLKTDPRKANENLAFDYRHVDGSGFIIGDGGVFARKKAKSRYCQPWIGNRVC